MILLAGLLLLVFGLVLRFASGLRGSVVYMDDERTGEVLYSAKHQLAGKPDYIERVAGDLIPVEFKSTRAPEKPYTSHAMQLLAYCLLVEDRFRQRVPEGRLIYNGRSFTLPFGDVERVSILRLISKMQMLKPGKVKRSHNCPERCRSCAFVDSCPDSLA